MALMIKFKGLGLYLAATLFTTPALISAQGAAEPWEQGCMIQGLVPNGDGFLSIRQGPGTQHREIARVRNDDALFLDRRKCQGNWCLAEGGAINNQASNITGWFHTGWCMFYP